MNWTREWPTELGRYWFYGYPYGKQKTEMGLGDKKPFLSLVTVDEINNGLCAILEGNFLYEEGEMGCKPDGVFLKADVPELPNLEE